MNVLKGGVTPFPKRILHNEAVSLLLKQLELFLQGEICLRGAVSTLLPFAMFISARHLSRRPSSGSRCLE